MIDHPRTAPAYPVCSNTTESRSCWPATRMRAPWRPRLSAWPISESVTRLRFDAIKLPHHGSMSNISEAWLQWVDCKRWLISTNGAVFHHPNIETVELIARRCPQPILLCNYRDIADRLNGEAAGRWQADSPEGEPAGPAGGLCLRLPTGSG